MSEREMERLYECEEDEEKTETENNISAFK